MNATEQGEFDAFYQATYARTVGLVGAMLGSQADAEEVVQDAFVRLIPRWTRVRSYENPEAWLRQVALRQAQNRRRKIENGLRAITRLARRRPADEDRSSAATDAVDALLCLPLKQRIVLFYFHFLDLDIASIARELDLPVGTVKSRLSRGRAQLHRLFVEREKLDAESR